MGKTRRMSNELLMQQAFFADLGVLVLGDLMLDQYVEGTSDRISPESTVPVVDVTNRWSTLGGAGNVALNLARLGIATTLVGVLGDDQAGVSVQRIVEDEPNLKFLCVIDSDRPTTAKERVLVKGEQLVRLDIESRSAVSGTVEDDIVRTVEERLRNNGIQCLVISDYAKGSVTRRVTSEAIRVARACNIPVLVDPKSNDLAMYAGATLVKPNFVEFSRYSDEKFDVDDDPEKLFKPAEELRTRIGTNWLLVTLGDKGMILVGENSQSWERAPRTEVFDVTGAGDTIAALMAASLARGDSVTDGMALASIAASVVISKHGAASVSIGELVHELGRQSGSSKVVPASIGGEICSAVRASGKKIVFTNGVFDLTHEGHIRLLREAKSTGDFLVVGINSDSSTRALKGPDRPISNEGSRAAVLSEFTAVDLVVIFDEETPLELINKLRPDVLVKGGDYVPETIVGSAEVDSWGGRTVTVPLLDGISTTILSGRASTSVEDTATE
jgi:D-beta-D-heptose 7-phosphate kinase / D-beta-D-heptose 1-phosphate adenosyltransferase